MQSSTRVNKEGVKADATPVFGIYLKYTKGEVYMKLDGKIKDMSTSHPSAQSGPKKQTPNKPKVNPELEPK